MKGRPRMKVRPSNKNSLEIPSDKTLIGEKCGLFQQKCTNTPENRSEPLPKIVGIDPGQKDMARLPVL